MEETQTEKKSFTADEVMAMMAKIQQQPTQVIVNAPKHTSWMTKFLMWLVATIVIITVLGAMKISPNATSIAFVILEALLFVGLWKI